MTNQAENSTQGVVIAISAFVLWGLFPFYFKALAAYSATEIIAHRIVWTFFCCLILLTLLKKWQWLHSLKQQPKTLVAVFVASWLMAANWLIYVWAVNHDQVLEASLGYFISPLLGVLLAVVVLKERLRKLQLAALLFASTSVLLQLVLIGKLPLVSLGVAGTFAVYGMLHKRMPLAALPALCLESLFILPFVVLWLTTHDVASSHASFWASSEIWFLMLAGPITLLPLLLYNSATKLVSFSLLSFLAYITPSMIFMLAVFYYQEPFSLTRLGLFSLIWVGLILFSIDLWQHKKPKVPNQ